MKRVVAIDRRLERVTQGVAAIAEALRDDTAPTLAKQQDVVETLEHTIRRLADAVEQFAVAVRTVATARILATPDPDAPAAPGWLARPIGELPGLPPLVAQRLESVDIDTVADLLARVEDLPRLRNVGHKAVHRILAALLAALREGTP